MFRRLADRFILRPTNHFIATDGKTRCTIEVGGTKIEVWVQRAGMRPDRNNEQPDLFILKFPGSGGRAERATEHPADCWPSLAAEVWAVNPPGYGGSGGQARLRFLPRMADAVFAEMQRLAWGRPILVTGNSLGAAIALYVAARYPIHGLLLRNPPPLRQVIVGRFGWRTFGLGARWVAGQVPRQLCSISNAGRTSVPAVFVTSGADRVVPPRFQQKVIAAHAGEHQVMLLPGAGHASPMDEADMPRYAAKLNWLLDRVLQHFVSST